LLKCYQGRLPKDVRLFDAGTDGMGVMFMARGATSLIVVDASATGAEAGAIHEVPGEELEGAPPDSHTLHDFRWDHALYAGRKIFRDDFPKDVSVYLIEAANLAFGLELSPPVSASVERVTEMLRTRIDAYAASE
jgi:hydrogenase maturation protease